MMRPEDVKGELTEYLGKMAINQLFAKVVEQLLLERPPNPIKFIINFLATKFPEQAVGSMADPNRLVEIPQEKRPTEGAEEKVKERKYRVSNGASRRVLCVVLTMVVLVLAVSFSLSKHIQEHITQRRTSRT